MTSYAVVQGTSERTRRATVAVIGAGAAGLAVALQLRRGGVDRVVVVERASAPGMGSTARANGGVRAQFSTAVNIAFSTYTIGELQALDRASGGLVGYRPNGYLLIAGASGSAETLQTAYELQRSAGVPVEWLSVDRVAEVAPYVRLDNLLAATYCATDGLIDPQGVAAALHHAALELGVSFVFDAPVHAIERIGEVTVLRCGSLRVEAQHVINAAGAYAREVAALAGVELPVTPRRRNLACTEPIPGFPASTPMCIDLDTGLLTRAEAGGALIGWSDPHSEPTFDMSFEPLFLEQVAERAGNRFPFLELAPINPRKCWAGLYPETVDHHAIVGAPAAAPWFVQCAGFGGHGIMHSMAAGLAVTELIRDQRCTTFDLSPLRVDRFHDASTTVETAVF